MSRQTCFKNGLLEEDTGRTVLPKRPAAARRRAASGPTAALASPVAPPLVLGAPQSPAAMAEPAEPAGSHRVRLWPDCSQRARSRPVSSPQVGWRAAAAR